MTRSLLLATFLVAPLVSPIAQTMQTGARPFAGTIEARPDRPAEMLDLTIRALQESGIADCVGMVDPSAPDAVVEWRGGTLAIYTRAAADATLLVYGPDQQWHCNDDAEGLSPLISIQDAPSGRYAVWVGAFASDQPDMRATLVAGPPGQTAQPDPNGQPSAGRLELHGGFEANTGATEQSVRAGGVDAVAPMNLMGTEDGYSGCMGFIDASQPTVVVNYMEGGPGSLAFQAFADEDLTLLVNGPDGSWSCNDDYDGVNPMVGFEQAQTGRYAVWVATYGSRARGVDAFATLTISEMIPEQEYIDYGEDYGNPTPYSTGSYTPLQIDGRPNVRLALEGDDEVRAGTSIMPMSGNPVRGDACAGVIEAHPTASLTIVGDGPVSISASGELDLTMTLRTPSGNWFCSDDANGLNPGVQVDDVEPGAYLIWVGAFTDVSDNPTEVEVVVSRGELEVSSPQGGSMFEGNEFPPYEEASYEGSALLAGSSTRQMQPAASDGETLRVPAGGNLENPLLGGACQGFISGEATAAITVGDQDPVTITATGDTDLTMVVKTSDGRWFCSDDADGSDPMVWVEGTQSGQVLVWVGTFSNLDDRHEATLRVVRDE